MPSLAAPTAIVIPVSRPGTTSVGCASRAAHWTEREPGERGEGLLFKPPLPSRSTFDSGRPSALGWSSSLLILQPSFAHSWARHISVPSWGMLTTAKPGLRDVTLRNAAAWERTLVEALAIPTTAGWSTRHGTEVDRSRCPGGPVSRPACCLPDHISDANCRHLTARLQPRDDGRVS